MLSRPRYALFILLVAIHFAGEAVAQGVQRVTFADLAVLRAEISPNATGQQELPQAAIGQRFSLSLSIENLGDLPARQTGAVVQVGVSSEPSTTGSYIELIPEGWRYRSVVYLDDGLLPSGPNLNTLQSGELNAIGLRFPDRPGVYLLSVCIVFPSGAPFGERQENNCALPIRIKLVDPS